MSTTTSAQKPLASEPGARLRVAVVFSILLLVAAFSVGLPIVGIVIPTTVGILAFIMWQRTKSKYLIAIAIAATCLVAVSVAMTTTLYQIKDVTVETRVE